MAKKSNVEKNTVDAGFTLVWLAKAFRTTRHRVQTQLADMRPKGKGGKAALYDLNDAAQRLVAVKIDADELLKRATTKDLPPRLQTEVWAALRQEKKFMQEAGDLWETNAVFEMLSECFGEVRSELRVHSEAVEREVGLTGEQRKLLTDLTHQTLNNLRDRMLRLAGENATPSALETLTTRVR